jgi:predicted ArsR family transcriptional regulator
MQDRRDAGVSAVAALEEPTRRRLYEHVVRQADPVSRDDVAAAMQVPRATVAFHLDRLVQEGLLDVTYERRTGRTGPGAGRPAKLYRRSDREVAVSLPDRRYDLAGQLLAGALEEAERTGESPRTVLQRHAYEAGRRIGSAASGAGMLNLLEAHGYEPRSAPSGIALANCPFHSLAIDHTEIVCDMNLRLLEGVLNGMGNPELKARISLAPPNCCVRLERLG